MAGGSYRLLSSSKIIAPNRESWGLGGTNSGSVNEPLLWEVRFFIGNREGIEELAKPIFVRARPSMAGTPRVPFNGWRASRLAGMPHAWPVYLALFFCYGSEGLHLLVRRDFFIKSLLWHRLYVEIFGVKLPRTLFAFAWLAGFCGASVAVAADANSKPRKRADVRWERFRS